MGICHRKLSTRKLWPSISFSSAPQKDESNRSASILVVLCLNRPVQCAQCARRTITASNFVIRIHHQRRASFWPLEMKRSTHWDSNWWGTAPSVLFAAHTLGRKQQIHHWNERNSLFYYFIRVASAYRSSVFAYMWCLHECVFVNETRTKKQIKRFNGKAQRECCLYACA